MSNTKLLSASIVLLLASASVNAQWYQQTPPTIPATTHLTSVNFLDASTGMTVGNGNQSYKTTAGGVPWFYQGSGTANDKLLVKFYNKDTVVMGQTNATIRRSLNNSNASPTWSSDILVLSGASTKDVNDIAFMSKTDWLAVGGDPVNQATGGRFVSGSTNSGQTWAEKGVGSGMPTLFGVEYLGGTTFAACGGNSSMFLSTDGGNTWTAIPVVSAATSYFDIDFPTGNTTTGYAVGGSSTSPTTGGAVLKTVNGGLTWTPLATYTVANTLFGVHAVSQDTCYVVGDGGKIHVTTDGGVTWTQQTSPVTTTLNKIHFPTSKVGYICGVNGVILKTITGGFIAPLVVNAGNDASICPGACATLAGSPAASGGTAPYTYAWSTGATTSSIVVCPTGTASYTLTVTDALNTTASDVATVTVYTVPSVDFFGLDSLYCSNNTGDTLISTPVGGMFSGSTVGANDSVFNPATAGPGTYTVTYSYTTTPGGCVASASHVTTILPLPTPAQICMVTVDSTIAKHNTDNIVIWDKPAATNITAFNIYRKSSLAPTYTMIASVSYSANATYSDAGSQVDPTSRPHDYAITTVDTCGVESAQSAMHSTIWLKVPAFSLPAKFALDWTDYAGFSFTTYDVQRSTNGGTSWSVIGGVLYSAGTHAYNDGPTPAPSTSSRYRIRAKHSTGCGTYNYTYSNWTADYTGVNEIDLGSFFSVYPNPNHGTFNLLAATLDYEVQEVRVCNLLGEVVYQHVGKDLPKVITIPGATSGMYKLQIITDGGTAVKKITVQ